VISVLTRAGTSAIRRGAAMVLAASALAAAAVVLSPAAPQAHAIDDGKDINWYLKDGAAGYNNMINAVRNRVKTPYINSIDKTKSANEYFSVNIWRSDWNTKDIATVRVILRSSDLYVQGIYSPQYAHYYRFGDATMTAYRPTSGGAVDTIGFNGDYGSMQSAAGWAFNGTTLGRAQFEQYALAAENGQTTQARARAMMTFVQGIAEGARFDYISSRISGSFTAATGAKMNSESEGLAKNWSKLGKNIVTLTNNPKANVFVQYGALVLQTAAQYAAVLALILFSS
jgi:hypothetical protein